MQVTKTVRNIPLSHGHRHEVMNATDWSRRRWRFAPDCPTRQSNAVSDLQRLAPSPDSHGPASYPTPCSQQGWGRGCWEATDWKQWKPEPLTAVTRPSHGPYGSMHCPAEKWRSRQKLHGCRAASPVSAAHPDNVLHLFWCQGPRIWGGFGPASTHRQIPWRTLWKLSECATTNPLQWSSSLTLQERRHDGFADFLEWKSLS